MGQIYSSPVVGLTSDSSVNIGIGSAMSYDTFGSQFDQRLLGRLLGANFNSTADQAIAIVNSAKYHIQNITICNASVSLTTAAGGFYDGAAKTGNILVAAAQVYSALTSALAQLNPTLAAYTNNNVYTAQQIYFSLTTAQGVAATADIYIYGFSLQ